MEPQNHFLDEMDIIELLGLGMLTDEEKEQVTLNMTEIILGNAIESLVDKGDMTLEKMDELLGKASDGLEGEDLTKILMTEIPNFENRMKTSGREFKLGSLLSQVDHYRELDGKEASAHKEKLEGIRVGLSEAVNEGNKQKFEQHLEEMRSIRQKFEDE
jgi:hypothetical protein